MNWTAEEFTPHPEGGRFRELYRSAAQVTEENGNRKSALTHIYFHLRQGEVSRFHRVRQEEVWNLYRGSLRLWILDPESGEIIHQDLSDTENRFCYVIPPGHWQAAEVLGDEALVGCTVAPGFEFEDFELISPDQGCSEALSKQGLERFF